MNISGRIELNTLSDFGKCDLEEIAFGILVSKRMRETKVVFHSKWVSEVRRTSGKTVGRNLNSISMGENVVRCVWYWMAQWTFNSSEIRCTRSQNIVDIQVLAVLFKSRKKNLEN